MGERTRTLIRFAPVWPLGLWCGQVTWASRSSGPICVHDGRPIMCAHDEQVWMPNYWAQVDVQ